METLATLTTVSDYSRAIFKVRDLRDNDSTLSFYDKLWGIWYDSPSKDFKVLKVKEDSNGDNSTTNQHNRVF